MTSSFPRVPGHDKLVAVAIDFGTTYSGYAFSLVSDYVKDPMKIMTNTMWSASSGGMLSFKAPTCLLFDKDKTFLCFGYEAEDKYAELAEDEEHEDYYFFRTFKMKLHRNININRNTFIEDELGKGMNAKTVFAAGIKYLKDHAFELLETRGLGVNDWEVQWVLTVPAIWSDAAKQFMREAAQRAEIMNDQLCIALEPEAASVFCQHYPDATGNDIFSTGSKYMVIDLGGGTADITVHQVREDGRLSEVHKATGGAWGGTRIDESFLNLLKDIFGEDSIDKFVQNKKADFFELRREFEVKKRTVSGKLTRFTNIKFPMSLKEAYESTSNISFADRVKQSPYGDQVKLSSDKLCIHADLMKGLFLDVLTHLVEHIRDIMDKPCTKGVKTFLMVGGFSESPIMSETIREKFPNVRVIVPNDSGLAVLKGAVLYGHQPKAISARVARFTVGVGVSKPFIDGHHPNDKKKCTSHGAICTDVFQKYIQVGDNINIDDEYCISFAAERGSTSNRVRIYRSPDPDPMFVTDPGCEALGEIIMTSPETDENNLQTVDVTMSFGGTELKVEAHNRGSGQSVYRANFDMLQS